MKKIITMWSIIAIMIGARAHAQSSTRTHTIKKYHQPTQSTFIIDIPTTSNHTINTIIAKDTHHYRKSYLNYIKHTKPTALLSYHQTFDIITETDSYILILFTIIQNQKGTENIQSKHTLLINKHTQTIEHITKLLRNKDNIKQLTKLVEEKQCANKPTTCKSHTNTLNAFVVSDKYLTIYPPLITNTHQLPTIRISYKNHPELFDFATIKNILSNHKSTDCTRTACVALTFDDGPGKYTNKLLNILAEHNTKATFFILGTSIEHHPETLIRMTLENHEIGNHSRNHADFRTLSGAAIIDQINDTDKLIKKRTNQTPLTFRPPYGAYDDHVIDTLTNQGKSIIMRSLDPKDRKMRRTNTVVWRISQARPGDIIIGHDIRPTTVNAIPQVIKNLQAKGYTFVTIHELIGDTATGKIHTRQP